MPTLPPSPATHMYSHFIYTGTVWRTISFNEGKKFTPGTIALKYYYQYCFSYLWFFLKFLFRTGRNRGKLFNFGPALMQHFVDVSNRESSNVINSVTFPLSLGFLFHSAAGFYVNNNQKINISRLLLSLTCLL